MNSNISSEVISTKLHRNAFAVLDASMTNTRAEINELAENKAFVLDEVVVQDARRVLTNPMARLTAEVSWLPGMSVPTIKQMLSPGGLEDHISISADVLALTRANVLAALLELRLNQSVSQKWMTSQLSVLLQLADLIEIGAVEDALNANRKIAGFQEITRIHLVEAIREQRAYFLEICQQILNRLLPTQRGVLLTQLLKGIPGAGILLHMLIDEYAFASTTDLEELLHAIKSQKNEILRFPKSSGTNIERVTKTIEAYGERARPILLSREQRGLDHDPTFTLFDEIRDLSIVLANKHEQFDSALKITMALQDAIGVVESIYLKLAKDIETLTDLVAARNEYAGQAKAAPRSPTNHRPTSSPQRWPDDSTPQTVSPNRHPRESVWGRIPVFVKAIAVLLLIGWGSNAITSDSDENSTSPAASSNSSGRTSSSNSSTSRSQSADRCANISAWWDATNVRWNSLMSLADQADYSYGYVDTWTQTQMRALIGEQRMSGAPSAAMEYNNALVTYMDFISDTASGTTDYDLNWDWENDRLFDNVQRYERSAASSCGIILR